MDLIDKILKNIDDIVENYGEDIGYEEATNFQYGFCECSIKECTQRVQDNAERDFKHPMCVCHRKFKNGLIGRARDYASGDDKATTQDWDLRLEGD